MPIAEKSLVININTKANITVIQNLSPVVTLKSRWFTIRLPNTVEEPNANAARTENNAALCSQSISVKFIN
jgi:hypothetical protein